MYTLSVSERLCKADKLIHVELRVMPLTPPLYPRTPAPHAHTHTVASRFQVGELRKHQLLEVRVRCYAIRHERLTTQAPDSGGRASPSFSVDGGLGAVGGRGGGMGVGGIGIGGLVTEQPEQVYFQSHNMRLQHPDDELGGNLLLVLPQVGTEVVNGNCAWLCINLAAPVRGSMATKSRDAQKSEGSTVCRTGTCRAAEGGGDTPCIVGVQFGALYPVQFSKIHSWVCVPGCMTPIIPPMYTYVALVRSTRNLRSVNYQKKKVVYFRLL